MTTTATDLDDAADWHDAASLAIHSTDENGVTRETRYAVYARDNFRCRKCGEMDADKLTVHHVIFRSQGGNHRPENLVTVCWPCHKLIHDKILNVYRRRGEFYFSDVRHWRSTL